MTTNYIAADNRPLCDVPMCELQLELALRRGPAYQCHGCNAYHDRPNRFDNCPTCGRKGYLCGSFRLDRTSPHYATWEKSQNDFYRPIAAAREVTNA